MCDIDKMIEDKENVAPAVTVGLFPSCSSITAKIGEYFPVYFNRKRRRDSSDDTDEEHVTDNSNEKRPKTTCSTLMKSIQLLSKIPIFSMARSGSDMDSDRDHQCVQYLDYMSQRESFD